MLPTKLTLTGALTFAIGMMVLAIAFSFAATQARVVEGGGIVPTSTPDPCQQQSTSIESRGDVAALQSAPCTATPTATRVRDDDDTPTRTATAETTSVATNTSVPSSPPPAATATQPAGGAGAGGVAPPNTGTGELAGTGTATLWVMVAGAMLAITGAGAVVTGTIRRR